MIPARPKCTLSSWKGLQNTARIDKKEQLKGKKLRKLSSLQQEQDKENVSWKANEVMKSENEGKENKLVDLGKKIRINKKDSSWEKIKISKKDS